MNNLRQALRDYLAVRRSLGFDLRDTEFALNRFISFAEQEGASFITSKLALRWAQRPVNAQPAWWARRLSMVRCFAQHLRAAEPRTEIPPRGLLPYRCQRKSPYLFSDQEIEHLLQAAQELPSKTGLRSATYVTLFGLLTVTGMRTSESIHLDRDDVDLAHGLLTIRQTKFKKSRYVPIHSSTRSALRDYQARRDQVHPRPNTPSFFLSEQGRRLTGWSVRQTFVKLSRQTGLRGPSDSHGPRLHDLRHRFAVRTLLNWYRSGVDVERHVPRLATYLGHTHFSDTYWYLTAIPDLLQCAALRLEAPQQNGPRP